MFYDTLMRYVARGQRQRMNVSAHKMMEKSIAVMAHQWHLLLCKRKKKCLSCCKKVLLLYELASKAADRLFGTMWPNFSYLPCVAALLWRIVAGLG